jgi:hypothetical protein
MRRCPRAIGRTDPDERTVVPVPFGGVSRRCFLAGTIALVASNTKLLRATGPFGTVS